MTHNKFDPKDGPLLSPYEEMLRSRAAGERMMERARKDPEYARQILVDIGYFEMMADEDLESEDSKIDNPTHTNGADAA